MKFLSLMIVLAFAGIQAQQTSESVKPTKDSFDVAMLAADGDKFSREDVSLRLSEEALIIEARCHCAIIKEFKYSDIKAIKYSPKENRLAIGTDTDNTTLKMDENNHKAILAAFEARGLKIETMSNEQ
ncbi:MAG: hypothetical protein AB1631_01565 [Acidobacteriota bacterium]